MAGTMKDKILLAHGSGGSLSREMIRECFLGPLNNPLLDALEDAAVFNANGRLAFTTDSYVVNPLFFPGGDIGKLSVCGTVNDLSMMGAAPMYLSLSLIIEEGFDIEQIHLIVASIRSTAAEAGVEIVTGDTKVVERRKADRLFINTAGIGRIAHGVKISSRHARIGDKIILSGTIGDHGIAVLGRREGFAFETRIESDCAPLNGLVAQMLKESEEIRSMRDPTRGGLAAVLNEIAEQSKVGMKIEEQSLPVCSAVRTACDFLGMDPLHLANEGKLVAVVSGGDAEKLVSKMRHHKYGRNAAVIGKIVADHPGSVVMKTCIGSHRIIPWPSGELLPRIC